jgi:hypothetical protein
MMFSKDDLWALLDDVPSIGAPIGVSIFLPTHVRGAEIRQDPIRLKNLVAEARDKLIEAGTPRQDAEALLAPATALVEDYEFWQHQRHGLAVFLGGAQPRHFKLPVALEEQVVVRPGFHIRPLLPVLARDGAFVVLTITADIVRLYDASRFSLSEDGGADIPRSLDEVTGVDEDYENPLQAAPVNRPNIGSVSVGKAQVYGDSPEDWRKGRSVEFMRRIAAALEAHLANDARPVVLVADAGAQGHFRQQTKLGAQLAGVIETNPESMDRDELHAAAYEIVRPAFEAEKHEAVERVEARLGSGDGRVAITAQDILEAAQAGRVDTLLLAKGADGATDTDASEDLFDTSAVETLRNGGEVRMLAGDAMPKGARAAALLRY